MKNFVTKHFYSSGWQEKEEKEKIVQEVLIGHPSST
jgi:hypothetical protein